VTHSFKLAALVISSFALTGVASADPTFTAKFRYDNSQTAEANYTSFERTAKRECRVDIRMVGGLASKTRIEADCEKRLLADAIAASGQTGMIALHAARTGASTQVAKAN
jgi:hypothetical protein